MPLDVEKRDPNLLVPLTTAEERDLQRFESTIAANLAAFFQVGYALMEVNQRKLYRGEFKTFEEYCRKRWEMHKAYAYRLISAAEVCKNLSPIGDIPLPDNECQIRPLIGLKPVTATKAWKRAYDAAGASGRITGALVQKAVGELTGRKKQKNIERLRNDWQIRIAPLLSEALNATRKGDKESVAEIIEKISLLLLVGRRHEESDPFV
jgi:hypothetical protein